MISAVITTYKRPPQMVSRAIDSILRQTYTDIEIIVVDDSPKDYLLREQVRHLVLEYAKKCQSICIRYIQHPENLGSCAARNTGLSYAQGKYIAYLDDDDEWMSNKLEKQLYRIENTEAGLVYCGSVLKNDVTGDMEVQETEYFRGKVFDKLLYRNFVDSTSFPLIRTECLRSIGGFDVLMQSAQDYDVWLRIAAEYEIDYVAEPLVIYHVHAGEQITSNPQKKISGLERINEKFQKELDNTPLLWWRRHIVITPYYAQNDERMTALKVWMICVSKCPFKCIDNLKYLCLIMKAKKR